MGKISNKFQINRIVRFIQVDIWRMSPHELSRFRALLLSQAKIIFMAVRNFEQDRCHLRASGLTFYSVLSIVPVFAMAFGIAKGFALERVLREKILESFSHQQEVVIRIIQYAENLLKETRGGLVAGVGVVALLWTVIKILGNIEASFNDIWKVRKSRFFGRKITDYLSIVLVAPLLIIISSGITVTIVSQITHITERVSFLATIGPLIIFGLKLLPYSVIWVLFTFSYMFIPNTQVRFPSALYGGVLAGSIYQIVQLIYVEFQIGVAKYGAIYGSFAALPLFLLWLQLSWLIVLFGTELSYAFQYRDVNSAEYAYQTPSRFLENLLCLRIAQLAVAHFTEGKMEIGEKEIANALRSPLSLIRNSIQRLISAEILEEVKEREGDKDVYYLPVKDPDVLTVGYVLSSLEHEGDDQIPLARTKEVETISNSLKEFENVTRDSSANLKLKEIKTNNI